MSFPNTTTGSIVNKGHRLLHALDISFQLNLVLFGTRKYSTKCQTMNKFMNLLQRLRTMNMEIFEENYFKHKDFEIHEEITDEYDVDCERMIDLPTHKVLFKSSTYISYISILYVCKLGGL